MPFVVGYDMGCIRYYTFHNRQQKVSIGSGTDLGCISIVAFL